MIRRNHLARSGTARRGTTLVEVLISLLLMGIGLVTLATLFPAAIIRTVRAHQLTTSTILRFNAESVKDMHTTYHAAWPTPGANVGNRVHFVVDPRGFVEAPTDGNALTVATEYGYGYPNAVPVIVPPVQRVEFDDDLNDDGLDSPITLDLNNDGAVDSLDATLMTTLPDSWEAIIDATVDGTGFNTTEVTVDPDVDISEIDPSLSADDPVSYRVILFSNTGKGGHVRSITGVTGNTIQWDDALNAIDVDGDSTYSEPGEFVPERVRVEVSNPKFSWLMTVRRSRVNAANPMAPEVKEYSNNADVVVFFKRSLNLEDEQIYSTGTNLPTDPATGNPVTPLSLSADFRTFAYLNYSGVGGTKPEPKNGNFIFDAEHCRWYRIVNVEDDSTSGFYKLTIDRPAVSRSRALMLVRDVVDVYPLNTYAD